MSVTTYMFRSREMIFTGKLQLKQLHEKKPEKIWGFSRIWTCASLTPAGPSTNWATKPHVGSKAN